MLVFYTYDYMMDNVPVSDTLSTSSSPFSWNISRLGTAPAKPLIVITLAAASGVSALSFDIDGVAVSLSGSFVAGDVITIDGVEKVVKKNGVSV